MRRMMMAAGLAGLLLGSAALGQSNAAAGAGAGIIAPRLTPVFTLRIELAKPVEQGVIDGARHRFIAITGGTITGAKLTGTVMAGGGDWQAIHPGGLAVLDARYFLKASDGTVISITNPGVRVASAEVTERLARGEDVDPAAYYFRSSPRFEVAAGAYDWLTRKVFVARGIRRPDHVELEVFEVE
ncbi:MAG: hypothetical protein RLY97_1369 [Pseudomonadota bacterium]